MSPRYLGSWSEHGDANYVRRVFHPREDSTFWLWRFRQMRVYRSHVIKSSPDLLVNGWSRYLFIHENYVRLRLTVQRKMGLRSAFHHEHFLNLTLPLRNLPSTTRTLKAYNISFVGTISHFNPIARNSSPVFSTSCSREILLRGCISSLFRFTHAN